MTGHRELNVHGQLFCAFACNILPAEISREREGDIEELGRGGCISKFSFMYLWMQRSVEIQDNRDRIPCHVGNGCSVCVPMFVKRRRGEKFEEKREIGVGGGPESPWRAWPDQCPVLARAALIPVDMDTGTGCSGACRVSGAKPSLLLTPPNL